MNKEEIIQFVRKAHEAPLDELERVKQVLHEKYSVKTKMDFSEPFLFWKRLKIELTRVIVKRKLAIKAAA